MCGLTGILCRAGRSTADIGNILAAMTGVLAHRGPDAEGAWIDREAGIALGHRRLSIVDLTPAGAQPMHASNGRWVTVYNGELYNTEDLRGEIEQAAAPSAGADTRTPRSSSKPSRCGACSGRLNASTASSRSRCGTAMSGGSGSFATGWA